MSRHEGVSCDACLRGNFRGRRYKCLICYDYDLCAACYEVGATTTRHTTEHPMQCILTRSDFDLYYGGEALSVEQPQAFTCPYCGKMGFTETTLQEHVASDHSETSFEVVCPICASLPGGDPNLVTDDFAGHLTLEHRSGPRDLDEPTGSRHGVRRIPHSSRGVGGPRARRSNMHFSSSGGLSSLSPSSRESVDPIAELLSQLSGVRRSAAGPGSTPSQLQQLQMQLQLERQQVRAARQQLERLPRRQTQTASSANTGGAGSSGSGTAGSTSTGNTVAPSESKAQNSQNNSQFLLSRCFNPRLTDAQLQALERERSNHSLFVQEVVLSSIIEEASNLSLTGKVTEAVVVQKESDEKATSDEERILLKAPTGAPLYYLKNFSGEDKKNTTDSHGITAAQQPEGQGHPPVPATVAQISPSSLQLIRHQEQAMQQQQVVTQHQQQQRLHQTQQQPQPVPGTARHSVPTVARGPAPVLTRHTVPPPPQRVQVVPTVRVVTGTGTVREVAPLPLLSVAAALPAPGARAGAPSLAPSRRKPVRPGSGNSAGAAETGAGTRNRSAEPPPPR